MTNQENSDVKLTWQEIPVDDRRGFLLGYRVYLNTGHQLKLFGTHCIVLVYHRMQQGLFMAVLLGHLTMCYGLYCLLRGVIKHVFRLSSKLRPSVIDWIRETLFVSNIEVNNIYG